MSCGPAQRLISLRALLSTRFCADRTTSTTAEEHHPVKAIVATAYGAPDVLQLAEVTKPTPKEAALHQHPSAGARAVKA